MEIVQTRHPKSNAIMQNLTNFTVEPVENEFKIAEASNLDKEYLTDDLIFICLKTTTERPIFLKAQETKSE
jgi:hypothetical protein